MSSSPSRADEQAFIESYAGKAFADIDPKMFADADTQFASHAQFAPIDAQPRL
jgi:hypothetical protein